MNSGAPKELAVPDPLVTTVVLLFIDNEHHLLWKSITNHVEYPISTQISNFVKLLPNEQSYKLFFSLYSVIDFKVFQAIFFCPNHPNLHIQQ